MKYKMLLLLIFAGSIRTSAQQTWKWPKDSAETRKRASIYPDFMKNGEFMQAKENVDWLFKNAPDLNPSIYINGVKIYDSLASQTTDKEEELQYKLKILKLYDDRIKYFGRNPDVEKRKIYAAYRLFRKDNSYLNNLIEIFDDYFENHPEKIPDSFYLMSTDLLKRQVSVLKITDKKEILEKFGALSDFMEDHVKNPEEIQQKMFDIMGPVISMDCQIIEEWLMPRLKANSSDSILAKRIIALSLSQKCTEESFYMETVEILSELSPSYGILKSLAVRYERKGDLIKAKEKYELAGNYATEPSDLYEINIYLAKISQKQNQFATAKSYALKSLQYQPEKKMPYEIIGDLWYSSYETCKKGVSRVDDRLTYLAAFEAYEKAGDKYKMSLAEQQFPSMQEIFDELKKEGDVVALNCWEKTSVKLRRRVQVNNN